MPQDFSIVPCRFAGGGYAPGRERVFEVRYRRKRITKQADMQRLLGGVDQAIKRRIEACVVVIMGPAMPRNRAGRRAGGDNRFRQVVIDVGVNARKRELDTSDLDLAAVLKQRLPAIRGGLA